MDVHFSLARTIIAVLFAIVLFFGLVTLLLYMGMRGRASPSGNHELHSVTGASLPTRTRPGLLQSPSIQPLQQYPLQPGLSGSWSQTTVTFFPNRYPAAAADQPSAFRRAIERFPLPFRLISILFPETTPLLNPTPLRALGPHQDTPVARPNAAPLSPDSPSSSFNRMTSLPHRIEHGDITD